ncbi:hypothetical protein AKO1_015706 [Acrasis kona]|uniref:Uncharacterized protein n=1 Tax=Acrasis kona TaxID=1008807 RepID=A0AAW2ZHH2_9EUKA
MNKIQRFFSACTFDVEENPLIERRCEESHDYTNPHQQGCALTGPERTGKISLLFQYAYSIVKESEDSKVVFICSRHAATPIFKQPDEMEALKRVHMRYIDNGTLLRSYLSNIHLLPLDSLPTCICIDELSTILLQNQNQQNQQLDDTQVGPPFMDPSNIVHIKTWALLQNAIQFIGKKLNKEVNFVVTDSLESTGFFERFCPLVLRTQIYREQDKNNPHNIPDLRGEEDDTSVQVYLQVTRINGNGDPYRTRVLYHVSSKELVLKKWDYTL